MVWRMFRAWKKAQVATAQVVARVLRDTGAPLATVAGAGMAPSRIGAAPRGAGIRATLVMVDAEMWILCPPRR